MRLLCQTMLVSASSTCSTGRCRRCLIEQGVSAFSEGFYFPNTFLFRAPVLMTVIVFACVKIQLPSGMSNHTECSSNAYVYMCNDSSGIKCSWGGRVVEALMLNGP